MQKDQHTSLLLSSKSLSGRENKEIEAMPTSEHPEVSSS